MKKTKKLNMVIAIINIVLIGTLGLFSKSDISVKLRFAGGFSKGTYYQIGKTLDKLPGFEFKVQETKGSQDNINKLMENKTDIALAQMDVFMKMATDYPKLSKKIKVLIPIYAEEVHIIANKNIKKLRKIKNIKVNIGPKGSGIEITTRAILKKLKLLNKKITIDQRSTKDALDALLNKSLDMVFIVAGAPVKLLKSLTQIETSEIHLLPIGKKSRRKLLPNSNAYALGFPYSYKKIRRGTYSWVAKTIRTVSVGSVLLIRSEIDDNTVKQLINNIFSNKVELILSHKKWGELDLAVIKKSLSELPNYFHPQVSKMINSL